MSSRSLSTVSPIDLVVAHARTHAADRPEAKFQLFALVDAGQDKKTWQRFHNLCGQTLPILKATGGAADQFSPHLVALESAVVASSNLQAVLASRHSTTAYTLLCSELSLSELHKHLSCFLEVKLPGNLEMLLAFWDPAILGTLVGQTSDDSLHLPSPVLDSTQLLAFLSPMTAWWYCDRESRWHQVVVPLAAHATSAAESFSLSQAQEDMLVEASVPDQVLHHLELNQPHLFEESQTHAARYAFIKIVHGSARKLGLNGMRDLVNFAALCLIYCRRMQTDPKILSLLDNVQHKRITLDEALPLRPG